MPPTTTTLPTRSPTVAMAKPVAVGAATVRAFYGYNTLTDTSTWDAVLRSTAYYTPVYAALTRSVHPQQANDPPVGRLGGTPRHHRRTGQARL